MILISMLVALMMVLSACGDDGATQEPAVITDDSVVTEEEAVVAETPVTADTEVMTDTEAAETETDVETTTEVETDVIVDTEVITETEVFTQTDVTEVITETEVMTDVNVITDTETVQDTAVITDSAEVDTSEAIVLILFTDAEGSRYLADEEGQPIFAYTGAEGTAPASQDFEPLQASENVVVGEGLDQAMFSQVDSNGVSQMTYNDLPLYRFVGTGDAMQLAAENEFAPLTVDE
jgi:hypothetical protein